MNVLILGPSSFISTLDELRSFLKFNPIFNDSKKIFEIILFHYDVLQDNELKDRIHNSNAIKICASKKKNILSSFDVILELPTTIKEINSTIENVAAKKKFIQNSSIKVKNYFLNKNERKLFRLSEFIVLTEKEVQLIELFSSSKTPISKENILTSVWNYSADADTHTVETHIYRLRKKISDKFLDDKFILNNKDGYYL